MQQQDPDWFRNVAEYILREGLPTTLKLAAIAVTASTVIGLVLGTLITIRFRPLQALIRLYIEVWRGLPILVTVLFIYWTATAEVGGFASSSAPSGPRRSGSRSGAAPRSPRPPAAPSSRSRASSTKPRRRSGSAGWGGMRS